MIYAIQSGSNGPIKFGFSEKNPRGRLHTLQTAHYAELSIIALDEGGIDTERYIHKICAEQRIRGEWFKPQDETLEVLEAMKKKEVERLHTRCWARDLLLTRGKKKGESWTEYLKFRDDLCNAKGLPKRFDWVGLRICVDLLCSRYDAIGTA